MNTGRIKFEGLMLVSENAPLTVGLRLFLLGLDGKSCRTKGEFDPAKWQSHSYRHAASELRPMSVLRAEAHRYRWHQRTI